MNDNPNRPARRSPRLKGYNYSQEGAYFVTICTKNREYLFGEIADGEMQLNDTGKIVQSCWDDLPRHYRNIELDAFVIMPNHLHGIILILDKIRLVGEGLRPSPAKKMYGMTEIIRALKAFSARRINQLRDMPNASVWQRSFHDHIIRNEKELNILRQYTLHNAARWESDTFYRVDF